MFAVHAGPCVEAAAKGLQEAQQAAARLLGVLRGGNSHRLSEGLNSQTKLH